MELSELPSVQEALDGLLPPELARLKFEFEQGKCAFTKVKRYDGIYVGCHLEQLDHMELIKQEGRWSLARKRES